MTVPSASLLPVTATVTPGRRPVKLVVVTEVPAGTRTVTRVPATFRTTIDPSPIETTVPTTTGVAASAVPVGAPDPA